VSFRLALYAAVRAVNAGHERLRMRHDRCCLGGSWRRTRRFPGRFVLGIGGTHGVGERHGMAKPEVSSLRRVRVSGKHLHPRSDAYPAISAMGERACTAASHPPRLFSNRFNADRVALDGNVNPNWTHCDGANSSERRNRAGRC
jgi:hypothetical protein